MFMSPNHSTLQAQLAEANEELRELLKKLDLYRNEIFNLQRSLGKADQQIAEAQRVYTEEKTAHVLTAATLHKNEAAHQESQERSANALRCLLETTTRQREELEQALEQAKRQYGSERHAHMLTTASLTFARRSITELDRSRRVPPTLRPLLEEAIYPFLMGPGHGPGSEPPAYVSMLAFRLRFELDSWKP